MNRELDMTDINLKSGYTAIIGRSNVGKSTLINLILNQRLCIVSRRPQTTRHRICGIKTLEHSQLIYVDTPGIHTDSKRAINRYMNRSAVSSINYVDVVLFIVDLGWTYEDEVVLKHIKINASVPVILVINKIDKLANKNTLLPYIDRLAAQYDFINIVPISARKDINIELLESEILKLIPEGELIFPKKQLTDRSSQFLSAELVREQLFHRLGQELPYAITVEIEQFRKENNIYNISAIIYVQHSKQKNIVIGKKGGVLKAVGKDARIRMEQLFNFKIFLQIWVKVREGWSNDESMLRYLGYNDDL